MVDPALGRTMVAELTRLHLGTINVICPDCSTMNNKVDVGLHTQQISDDVIILGAVSYPICGCFFLCRHLTVRCAILLENHESGTVSVENLYNLVQADHDDED